MASNNYDKAVGSLKFAILLIEVAIVLSFVLLIFTLDDSIKILSITGFLGGKLGSGLWFVWPVVGLTIASVAWAEFHFVRKARQMFADPDYPADKFGESCDDEARTLNDIRISLNKYAIFALPLAIGLMFAIWFAFINIAVTAVLIGIQVGLLMFLRDNAKLLKADRGLLS